MSVVAILLLQLLAIPSINISFCHGSAYVGCIKSEREALLRFKQDLKDPSNRLASWTDDGDCCSWTGVVCNNYTGHILELHLENPFYWTSKAYERSKLTGKVNPSLLDLKHLIHLDLGGNNFEGNYIPRFLGFMRNLRYLSLKKAGFMGMIPHQLGNLSYLQHLDLSDEVGGQLYVENIWWLSALSSLEYLDLSWLNLSKASDWLLVTNALPSLVVLKLRGCQLYNFPPLTIANSSLLATLDLSLNNFNNTSVLSWVSSLTHLVSLSMSYCNFQGPIPEGFQNLTRLRDLELGQNNFSSSIPYWLYKFSHLVYLGLRSNSLQGTISDSLANMTSITDFDFSFNKLEWRIPRSMGRLCTLKSISLSGVKLSQEISEVLDIFSRCYPDGPELLSMSDSKLFGHIPSFLGEFTSLVNLDLSFNKLNGTLSESHFANLTNLLTFDVSENTLTLNVNPNWHPTFQLRALGLRSCQLGPRFPSWLHSQKQLHELDLSGTGIIDIIPKRIWESFFHLQYLDLSHNQIYGEILNLSTTGYLGSVDLSSNNFSGKLPFITSELNKLDLSDNYLSGSIFNFLCNYTESIGGYMGMQFLNLGDNFLTGELPDCWKNWPFLISINLGNNKFTGNLPVSMGTLSFLESLHLQKNNLSGTIPISLKNCTDIVALDFGENQFVGNVPSWIGESFSEMVILNLRGNNFHGHLPIELCGLSSLQILDLAHNNLSGTIPRCFNNFSAMVTINYSSSSYIQYTAFFIFSDPLRNLLESASLVAKGKEAQYSTILNLVRSIDLSNNNFSGEIPTELTNLEALQTMNLSHNFFTGKIPENLGSMKSLESLDFSFNQLSGEIPKSFSSLTLLSYLNLSNNNLVGEIPSSTQLQSFDASSFAGNQLCGPPLPKNCSETAATTPGTENAKEDDEVDWGFYVSTALGFIVGFWSLIGSLLVNRRWRYMYSHFLYRLGDKLGIVVRKCC